MKSRDRKTNQTRAYLATNPTYHRPTLSSERPFPPARPGERGERWCHGTKIKWVTPAYLDRIRRERKAAVANGEDFVFVDEEEAEEDEREEGREEGFAGAAGDEEDDELDPYGLRALRAEEKETVVAIGGRGARPLSPVIEEEEEEEEEEGRSS